MKNNLASFGKQLPALGWRALKWAFSLVDRQAIKRLIGVRVGILHDYPPRPLRLPASYYEWPVLTDPPGIGIVTPSLNQGRYLERTLRSVLDQEYPRLEFAVLDGGSTDATGEILHRLSDRLTHWESRPDRGQAPAINRGFQKVGGEILAYLNSDDLLLPGTLHAVAHYFQHHPEVDVVYGHRVLIDEADNEIGRWVLPQAHGAVLTWADFIPQECLFWRRSIWERVGGALDESFAFAMDWDLLLRFRAAGARFARLPRFLGAFRVHAQQKTATHLATVGVPEMDRLRRRCHGRAVSRFAVRLHMLPFMCRQACYQNLYRLGLLRY